MPFEEQVKFLNIEGWTLSSWLYWFEPGQREWYWWDSRILDNNNFSITVEVAGSPFPWGSLEWLVFACGSLRIEEIE